MSDFYNLDLATIKTDIKTFLKDNSSILSDYNYEGSGVSALIELLAYVTQYQMFYLNAVSKELFLSSAQLSNSVYRLANMLNYIPKRNSAPYCTTTLTNTSLTSNVSVLTGATFSFGNVILTYIGDQEITLTPSSSVATISLHEGNLITSSFVSDGKPFQSYELLDREKVDNSYLKVITEESEYINIHNINPIQGGYYFYVDYMDKMNIKFDNGIMFQMPNVGESISISYLKTDGSLYDGAIASGSTLSSIISDLEAVTSSSLGNGGNYETIDEIKSRAMLFYTTQNRAVTEADYNTLITNYSGYSDLKDIILWGGDKEYVNASYNTVEGGSVTWADRGYIYVSSIKNSEDIYSPSYLDAQDKLNITTYFLPYKFMTIDFKYVDPSIIYITPSFRIKLNSYVNQDQNSFIDDIDNYLETNYTGFEKTFSKSNVMEYVSNKSQVNYLDFDFDYFVKINKGSETYSSLYVNGAINNIDTYYVSLNTVADQITTNCILQSGTYSSRVLDNGGHVPNNIPILSITLSSGMTFSSGATLSLIYLDSSTVTVTVSNINKLSLTGSSISIMNTFGTLTTLGYTNTVTGFMVFNTYSTSLLASATTFAVDFIYDDDIKISATKKMFIQPESCRNNIVYL